MRFVQGLNYQKLTNQQTINPFQQQSGTFPAYKEPIKGVPLRPNRDNSGEMSTVYHEGL